MDRLQLNEICGGKKYPLILIFSEGTILGSKSAIDFFNHKKYYPIKNCVEKIKKWEDQGARIVYLTSRRRIRSVNAIRDLLLGHGFPGSFLYFRTQRDKYKNISEALKPDVLIEDNCKSIGGRWQMVIPHVDDEIKSKIHSIVVKEFYGIDHLPDSLIELIG